MKIVTKLKYVILVIIKKHSYIIQLEHFSSILCIVLLSSREELILEHMFTSPVVIEGKHDVDELAN